MLETHKLDTNKWWAFSTLWWEKPKTHFSDSSSLSFCSHFDPRDTNTPYHCFPSSILSPTHKSNQKYCFRVFLKRNVESFRVSHNPFPIHCRKRMLSPSRMLSRLAALVWWPYGGICYLFVPILRLRFYLDVVIMLNCCQWQYLHCRTLLQPAPAASGSWINHHPHYEEYDYEALWSENKQ